MRLVLYPLSRPFMFAASILCGFFPSVDVVAVDCGTEHVVVVGGQVLYMENWKIRRHFLSLSESIPFSPSQNEDVLKVVCWKSWKTCKKNEELLQ